jgi:hypothetical protein
MLNPIIALIVVFAVSLAIAVIVERRRDLKLAANSEEAARGFHKRRAVLFFILGWVMAAPSYLVIEIVTLLPEPSIRRVGTALLWMGAAGLGVGTVIFLLGIMHKRNALLKVGAGLASAPLLASITIIAVAYLFY